MRLENQCITVTTTSTLPQKTVMHIFSSIANAVGVVLKIDFLGFKEEKAAKPRRQTRCLPTLMPGTEARLNPDRITPAGAGFAVSKDSLRTCKDPSP